MSFKTITMDERFILAPSGVRHAYEISYELLVKIDDIISGPGNRKTIKRKFRKLFKGKK